MRLIAHRGLLYGPNRIRENRVDTVMGALEREFDVEVDVRCSDQRWFLGHDQPLEEVPRTFLERPGVWVHCKNVEALRRATPEMHFFWHEQDAYTLTSRGFAWVYPGRELPVPRPTVAVVTGKHGEEMLNSMASIGVAGICTDWPAWMLKVHES
jgi:hypothetical protein